MPLPLGAVAMLNRFTADYLETLANADFRPTRQGVGPAVVVRRAADGGGRAVAAGRHRLRDRRHGGATVEAEVIGFRNGRTLLMNLGGPAPLLPKRAGAARSARPARRRWAPRCSAASSTAPGKPIDGLGPIRGAADWPLAGKLQEPLDRGRVLEPLDVGVRAINGLLTVGKGQRIGIMAGSGVGKSVLLGMMVRAAKADVIVIGLIGERSREVADFLETKVAGEARTAIGGRRGARQPLARAAGVSPTWRFSSRSRRTSAARTFSCCSRRRFRPTTT